MVEVVVVLDIEARQSSKNFASWRLSLSNFFFEKVSRQI